MKKSELKRWARAHMVGVENATFPSFTPDLSALDEEGIRLDVRQAIAHGFFSTMAAAEVGLTLEEAKRFVSVVADEARGKINVTVAILMDSLEQNVALVKHAEKAGCHGVLLGYPFNWFAKSADEIFEHTRAIAENTSIGLVLYPSPSYNFQRLHNSGFPIDALARMADLDNVIAMKCGEVGLYAHCHKLFGDKILIGCPVERFAPAMVLGFKMQWMGAGCYEVMQSPEKPYLVEYFRLLREGKHDAAMDVYWRIAPARNMFEAQFWPTFMLGLYNYNLQKYYQWCVGGNGGMVRQPSMKVHQHELDQTKQGFRMIGIEPREPDEEFYVGRVSFAKQRPPRRER
jgi:4-hydroxy-tetrahydrodipicolinate synthase